MGERLGEALLELRTDDRGFSKGVNAAERQARGLGVRFDAVAKQALRLGKNLAFAAAGAATALGYMVKRTIDHADAMSKSAQKAGVTTEALSELAWAADLSGVSLQELTNGLQRLGYNMGQAATGADKTLAKAFQVMGIEIVTASGALRSADAVMADIAERFAGMEDGADKTALALRIFGRAGATMIPMLNAGRTGLKDMADEANRLGIVISTDMGKRAEVFNDTMSRVRKGFEGVITRIAYDLLPQLQAFADMLNDPSFVADAEAMARGIVTAFGWIVTAIRTTIGWMRTLGGWWNKLKGWAEWAKTHDILGRELKPGADIPAGIFGTPKGTPGAPGPAPDFHPDLPPEKTKTTTPPFKFADLAIGGKGKGGKSADDEYKELTASALEFIAAQETEQQALGLTELAAAALRYEHELLNEAKRAGIKLSPEQVAELKNLAQQMAEAEAATGALADSLEFRRDVFRGFFSDLRSGLKEGKTFWEAFRDAGLNALDKIADRIFNKMLDAIDQLDLSLANVGSGGKSGGGGFLGGLFGGLGKLISGLFSGFFAEGGLIPPGSFGIVGDRGPEPVFGTPNGAGVLPNSALRRMGGGGGTHITFGLATDGALNIMPEVREVSRSEAEASSGRLRKQVPAIAQSAAQRTNTRGTRP
ncbi:MAG: phage tail tape measure protein [Notoacmeibacter sp.]|nr:phage tail tape measure protein [Notoacmeibacter sp.]